MQGLPDAMPRPLRCLFVALAICSCGRTELPSDLAESIGGQGATTGGVIGTTGGVRSSNSSLSSTGGTTFGSVSFVLGGTRSTGGTSTYAKATGGSMPPDEA